MPLSYFGSGGGGGSGTVTSVSVTTANGVSGTVATDTTTPAITLALGDITPTSVTVDGAGAGVVRVYDAAPSTPNYIDYSAPVAVTVSYAFVPPATKPTALSPLTMMVDESGFEGVPVYATTVTAAATTTLVVGSSRTQFFTGTTTHTVTLPVVTTLALGWKREIVNNSTGLVTVNSSGANAVLVMVAGSRAIFTCILLTGTTAASWSAKTSGLAGSATVVKLFTGTPDGTKYLRDDGTLVTPSGGGAGTKTYAVFKPENNQPPAANFATLDTRNSVAVLDFDDTTEEAAVFVGIMPEAASLGSGLIVNLKLMSTTATSGDLRFGVQFERGTTDLDADSFDTATEATLATSGTTGIAVSLSITATAIDSIVAGDLYRIRVYRDVSGADTVTGDAELIAVEVRSAA